MSVEDVANQYRYAAAMVPPESLQQAIGYFKEAQDIAAGVLEGANNPEAQQSIDAFAVAIARLQEAQNILRGTRSSITELADRLAGPSSTTDSSSTPAERQHPETTSTEQQTTPFTEEETALGVGVNRESRQIMATGKTPTSLFYAARGPSNLIIDVANDPELRTFLTQVKETVDAAAPEPGTERAEAITKQVVAQTPAIDETGEYHDLRQLLLGEALGQPVECIDRALAMEAALKMDGITNACPLISKDEHFDNNGQRVGFEMHSDVVFSLDGKEYVAITMGDFAGAVVAKEWYDTDYLALREALGLGRRTVHDSRRYPFFSSVKR